MRIFAIYCLIIIVFLLPPLPVLLMINRNYGLMLSKLRILVFTIICAFIFDLNQYVLISFKSSFEHYYDDFLILQLYFNLILAAPFYLFTKKLGIIRIFLYLQLLFIVIYFTEFIFTYYFSSTAPFHVGNWYWLQELIQRWQKILV